MYLRRIRTTLRALVGPVPPLPPAVRRRPSRNEVAFWPLAAVHAAWCTAYVLYPFFVLQKPRMDVLFVLYSVACVAHWMWFGECYVTYLEKRITFDGYVIGAAPCRNWLHDVLPDAAATAVLRVFLIACVVSLATVLLRWR
jgi:hypothetical protein